MERNVNVIKDVNGNNILRYGLAVYQKNRLFHMWRYFIYQSRQPLPYSLHDSRICGMELNGDTLLLKFETGFMKKGSIIFFRLISAYRKKLENEARYISIEIHFNLKPIPKAGQPVG